MCLFHPSLSTVTVSPDLTVVKPVSKDPVRNETGVFLCTAHPAKFRETIEETLKRPVTLPAELEKVSDKEILSTTMPADFELLREYL